MQIAARNGATLSFDFSLGIDWWMLAGFLLSLAPLYVIVGNLLRPPWQWRPKFKSRYWPILAGEWDTHKTTFIKESPDPTSVEFEKAFADILNEASLKKRKKNLLIVFDNLDRIDESSALKLWATLQTLVQGKQENGKPLLEDTWVVVPYDHQGIKKLWSSGHKDIDEEKIESFLDKSFYFRFRVPPLSLPLWRDYFVTQARSCFGGEKSTDIKEALQVFSLSLKGESPPTPRAIKKFINDLAVIWLQRGDEIPLSDAAFFLTQRDKKEEDILECLIYEKDFPEGVIAKITSSEVRDNFAALYFNVDKNLGRSIYLREPILRDLERGNTDEFKKKLKTHGPVIWDIFDVYIYPEIPEKDIAVLANFSKILGDIDVVGEGVAEKIRYAKKAIKEACKRCVKATLLFDEDITTCVEICKFLDSDIDVIKHFDNLIREELSADLDEDDERQESSQIAEQLAKWNEFVKEHCSQLQKPYLISSKADIETIVHSGLETSDDFQGVLDFSGQIQNIQNILIKAVTSNPARISAGSLVTYCLKEHLELNWGEIAESLFNRITVPNNLASSDFAISLEHILKLRSRPETDFANRITDSLTEGHWYHNIANLNDNDQPRELDKAIGLALMYNPNHNTNMDNGNARPGVRIVKNTTSLSGDDIEDLATNIAGMISISDWDKYFKESPWLDLKSKVLAKLISKIESLESPPPEVFFNNLSTLSVEIDKDRYREIVSNWIETDEFKDFINDYEISDISRDASNILCLMGLLDKRSKEYRALLKTSSDQISALEQTYWKTVLDNFDDNNVLSLTALLLSGTNSIKSVELFDAIDSWLPKCAEGEIDLEQEGAAELCHLIVKIMDATGREEILREKLVKLIPEIGELVSPLFVDSFSKEIIEGVDLYKDSLSVYEKILEVLLKSEDVYLIWFCSEIVSKQKKYLLSEKGIKKQNFLDRVSQVKANTSEEDDEKLKYLKKIESDLK